MSLELSLEDKLHLSHYFLQIYLYINLLCVVVLITLSGFILDDL